METKSYIIFFLFSNLCFIIRASKDSKDCSPSNLFSIEPASEIFRDQAKTFGLSDSFFIGTGPEYHNRGHGKYVKRKRKNQIKKKKNFFLHRSYYDFQLKFFIACISKNHLYFSVIDFLKP